MKNYSLDDMKISFQEVIEFFLNNNNVLGVFEENDNLIGFLIFFDYLEVKSKVRKIFNKIFGVNKIEKFPYFNEIHKKLLESYENIIYLLSLGVKKEYRIKITKESSLKTYEFNLEDIGQPTFIYLMATIDLESNTGVVTLISMSTPFLLSHLLDNTIRNQILICINDFDKANKKEKYINLYDFLESYLEIYKRGSPKTFVNLPYKKDKMKNS